MSIIKAVRKGGSLIIRAMKKRSHLGTLYQHFFRIISVAAYIAYIVIFASYIYILTITPLLVILLIILSQIIYSKLIVAVRLE